MIDASLLSQCSTAHSVSGFESEVRAIIRSQLDSFCEIKSYPSGNLLATLPASAEKAPSVMLCAHMDEIGFMVESVTGDGFLRVVPLGGWWNHTLPSQRMMVQARDGKKHLAIVGSKPPHLLPDAQRSQVLPTDALFMDVGASSAAEVDALLITAGCPVIPEAAFAPLSVPHRWTGKAFDNRIGVYTMLEVMRDMQGEQNRPCHVIAAGTVQEELGLRGAKALARECLPDVMLVLEGPPADDTWGMPPSGRMGQLGAGVQVRLYDPTHVTHPALAAMVREVAEAEGIPVQWAVRRSGGTDAGASYSNWEGIPSIVLGVPVRYIHAHQGILDERDVVAMRRLCVALLRYFDASRVDSLLHPNP